MKKKTSSQSNRSGMTLVVVMVMTLLCTAAVASVLFVVGARLQRAHKQIDYEKAFYIAEAGLERVAAIVTTGNEVQQPYLGTIGGGSYVTKLSVRTLFAKEKEIVIESLGKYNGSECRVAMYGIRGVSWARYALWYKKADPSGLVFARGESFRGRVYSTPEMIFNNDNTGKPQTHFYDRVWSAAKTIKYNQAKPVFDKGKVLGADKQEIADVDLGELKTLATELGQPTGLVLNGDVTILMEGKTMKITNLAGGWTNHVLAIPGDAIIFAGPGTYKVPDGTRWDWWQGKYVTTFKTVSEPGNINVSAPDGLDGQMTLVSENNINVTDHVKYANDPRTNPDSNDKLGLIAKNDVVVKVGTPNNLFIFAHIFCQKGGFGVENHGGRGKQGLLTVYGGIANEVRKAVGYTDGRGYSKNYIYDTRFARDPPPHYPRQPEELEWERWEDRWEG